MSQLFDLPLLLCSAASALAYVLATKSQDEKWSMFGGGGKNELTDERLEKVMEDAKKKRRHHFNKNICRMVWFLPSHG